jgi:hypothetical protein
MTFSPIGASKPGGGNVGKPENSAPRQIRPVPFTVCPKIIYKKYPSRRGRTGTPMGESGAIGAFLTHEFVVAGITFQNWMAVFAAMVLGLIVYFWLTRQNSI